MKQLLPLFLLIIPLIVCADGWFPVSFDRITPGMPLSSVQNLLAQTDGTVKTVTSETSGILSRYLIKNGLLSLLNTVDANYSIRDSGKSTAFIIHTSGNIRSVFIFTDKKLSDIFISRSATPDTLVCGENNPHCSARLLPVQRVRNAAHETCDLSPLHKNRKNIFSYTGTCSTMNALLRYEPEHDRVILLIYR